MWHLPRSSDPLTQTWRVVVVWSCGPRLVPVLGLRQSALANAFSPLRTSFPGHRLRQQRTASALFALPLLLHLIRFLDYALYVLCPARFPRLPRLLKARLELSSNLLTLAAHQNRKTFSSLQSLLK